MNQRRGLNQQIIEDIERRRAIQESVCQFWLGHFASDLHRAFEAESWQTQFYSRNVLGTKNFGIIGA